jgi:integrase
MLADPDGHRDTTPLHASVKIDLLLTNSTPEERTLLIEFNDYLKTVDPKKTESLSYNTRAIGLQKIRTLLRYLGGSISQFTIENVVKYLHDKQTPTAYFYFFKMFAEFLYQQKRITKRQLTTFTSYKAKNKSRKHIEVGNEKKFIIPRSRWKEVFSHPSIKKSIPAQMVCYIGLNFGLRPAEIVNLKLGDIFLDADIPFFYIQPHHEDNYHPKTISGIRRIPLNSKHIKDFKRFLFFRNEFLTAFVTKHDFLLYNHDGSPPHKSTIHSWIRDLRLEFSEFGQTITRKVSVYIFRYSCAWHYYKKSNNIYAVSKLLGHKSVKQTEVYLGLTEQQNFEVLTELMQ